MLIIILFVFVAVIWFLVGSARKGAVREVVQHVAAAEQKRAADYAYDREQLLEPAWKVRQDGETIHYTLNFSEMTLQIWAAVDGTEHSQTYQLHRTSGVWSAKEADEAWIELDRDMTAEIEKRFQQLQIFMATGRGAS